MTMNVYSHENTLSSDSYKLIGLQASFISEDSLTVGQIGLNGEYILLSLEVNFQSVNPNVDPGESYAPQRID